MKKIFAICLLSLLFISSTTLETEALTFDKLPAEQTTKQWSVKLDKAKLGGTGLVKSKEGNFHRYSLKVDNIGEDVLSAEIHLFRNQPNSKTKYALFGCPDQTDCNKNHFEQSVSLAEQLNEKIPYQFHSFLLAEEASELEVEIVWTQKGSEGRPLKERFIFTSK
ncbi:hypothetical protein [Peribacillus sp. Hz7]|uniref:hypothetical protein n=1 Tax=Peribacillus sp. Hz7 TaxID=3344873 RepID=UPI0035CBDED8